MNNTVTIKTLPLAFSSQKRSNMEKEVITIYATQDLECVKQRMLRELQYYIPARFDFEILLTLSINTNTFKIKVDYSEIKDKKAVGIIKRYFNS